MRRWREPATLSAVAGACLLAIATNMVAGVQAEVVVGSSLRGSPASQDAPTLPDASFMQMGAGVGWTQEHGYCEMCMVAVHQLQYGALPTCGNSAKATSFSTVRFSCAPQFNPRSNQSVAIAAFPVLVCSALK